MIGAADTACSVEDEYQFYENAGGPKEFWEVPGAHHGIADKGIPEHVGLTTYFDRMRTFLTDTAEGCPSR